MDLLDEAITKAGATGFVAFGPSENADILYLTRFPTVDPVTYFRTADGRESLVVSQMEITRALHQARCGAMTRAEAGLLDIMKEEKDPWRAHARMIAGLTGGHILLSPSIPAILMSELQSLVDVTVDRGTVAEMRSVKDESEIITIRRVQEITDGAMDLAIGLIRSSEPRGISSYGRATPSPPSWSATQSRASSSPVAASAGISSYRADRIPQAPRRRGLDHCEPGNLSSSILPHVTLRQATILT